jgi:hypothetical protein
VEDAEALATASRFEAAVQDAIARERIDLPWGVALRSPDLPGVYDANLARLEERWEEPTPDALIAELDRVRGDLWFDKLLVADAPTAERLRPGLEGAGFETATLLVLAYRDGPVESPPDAREVSQEEAHATRVAINTEELPPEAGEYAPHIAHLQERIAEEIPTRVFAAPADNGEIGALCSLYTVAGVSQIEEVSTLRMHRGEGLARSAVAAAHHAALEMAPELVFIVADEEDWVKDWYGRLGFAIVGRNWRFTRTTG